ncbi:MAG: hypothetical protein SOY73_16735 [Blautia sp.]|nr:hypothetical protein [Blautia sp.]MDY4000704.1 hypothetical protein [Blautia sp.]
MSRKWKRIVALVLACVTVICGSNIIYGDEMLPYAYRTGTTTQTFSKSVYVDMFGEYNGTITFEYTISGNYTYNASSGEIISAYGTKLVNYYITSTPSGVDWNLRLNNFTSYSPVVGGNGAYAVYRFSFTIAARPCPGGIPLSDYINVGNVSSSIRANAQ